VPNVRHIYQPLRVIDPVDHSIISDSEAPKIRRTAQLPDPTRPGILGKRVDRADRPFLHRSRQVLKVTLGRSRKNNTVFTHAACA
jgi:hypothetical protein